MTKMIRCIEGHVFDIDAQDKCPQCGWVPAAKKDKTAVEAKRASPFAFVGTMFGALIGGMEKLLGKIGLNNKPGLAAGIVYAAVILLFVGGASALTGAFRGGSTPAAAPSTNVSAPPPAKEVQKTPPPQQQQQQPSQPSESRQRNVDNEPQGPQQQQQQIAPRGPHQHQRPHINVPDEVKRALRRIF
ncbi:MAG: hypothetical protein K2P86_05035 [Xanthobacteraceae bacterium]|nr:hypothetical protein [Xanthobacteraceae bacterium]